MDRARPETVELVVDSLAAGGAGVGRDASGRVTFARGAAPGDRVRVAIAAAKKTFARGHVVEVLAPSAERVEPPCAYFAAGTCGGCQWQHVAIEAQRRAKLEIVRAALRRAIAAGAELAELATPVPALRWRRRARFHWYRPRKAARAVVGLFAPESRRVTDLEHCAQLEPALAAAMFAVRERLAPVLGRRGEIAALLGAGGVHIAIDGRCDAEAAASLVGVAGIAGVSVGGVDHGADSIPMDDEDGGARGRADLFAQAAVGADTALAAAVAEETAAAFPGRRVLELYAGSGALTGDVIAGEIVRVDRARPPGAPEPYLTGDAAAVCADLAARDERFDVVVLDPPRAGAREAIAPLVDLRPARIVYVSCDPATLARDADTLANAGYRAARLRPFDLMPQTAHVEVVATFYSPK